MTIPCATCGEPVEVTPTMVVADWFDPDELLCADCLDDQLPEDVRWLVAAHA